VFTLPHSLLPFREARDSHASPTVIDIKDNPMDIDNPLGFPEADKNHGANGAADPIGLRSRHITEQE